MTSALTITAGAVGLVVVAVLVGSRLRGCAERQTRPVADPMRADPPHSFDGQAAREPWRTILHLEHARDRWERRGRRAA